MDLTRKILRFLRDPTAHVFFFSNLSSAMESFFRYRISIRQKSRRKLTHILAICSKRIQDSRSFKRRIAKITLSGCKSNSFVDEGNRMRHEKILLQMNPIIADGRFYDSKSFWSDRRKRKS